MVNTFGASLQLKEEARPKFCCARPVSFALKETIEKELDKLEAEGSWRRLLTVIGLAGSASCSCTYKAEGYICKTLLW